MKELRVKKLDWYIFKSFILTFFIALILIIGIVIIFDISEKIDDFVKNEAPLKAIIVDYYLNFIPYFINMFSPLFVFITVVFYTSRQAANSEIIAILSSGVSYKRMLMPYIGGQSYAQSEVPAYASPLLSRRQGHAHYRQDECRERKRIAVILLDFGVHHVRIASHLLRLYECVQVLYGKSLNRLFVKVEVGKLERDYRVEPFAALYPVFESVGIVAKLIAAILYKKAPK